MPALSAGCNERDDEIVVAVVNAAARQIAMERNEKNLDRLSGVLVFIVIPPITRDLITSLYGPARIAVEESVRSR